ncbi:hypothetical protein AXG93_2818s1030 [Marchantia polymorpha subsp. ruderalis]|uniref:Uncharacterized protein n=1 Tax=Marchantia polymorpha subsp. ruderalis TaxID=1480154 RepID=A0A176VZR5_MARPO|nr:hypothetical protein AXG93_2818s1030 [Marchantia polymorpha subsp. ruderalis]
MASILHDYNNTVPASGQLRRTWCAGCRKYSLVKSVPTTLVQHQLQLSTASTCASSKLEIGAALRLESYRLGHSQGRERSLVKYSSRSSYNYVAETLVLEIRSLTYSCVWVECELLLGLRAKHQVSSILVLEWKCVIGEPSNSLSEKEMELLEVCAKSADTFRGFGSIVIDEARGWVENIEATISSLLAPFEDLDVLIVYTIQRSLRTVDPVNMCTVYGKGASTTVRISSLGITLVRSWSVIEFER